ncbi:MAG: autotransporter outer membrane beta-barrel domain-containing protein [Treponema sp.]|nr:autotransporter outer membrane beta-barrel domain-containing protein [Treponema sp.]
MKKVIALVVIFVCVGAALSAEEFRMSIGGGGLFDMSFGNGLKDTEKTPIGNVDSTLSFNTTSFGGFVFFDLTYAVIDVSFAHGSSEMKGEISGGGVSLTMSEDTGTGMQLGIGVMGKFPIDLDGITLFPLLGINYNMILSAKDKDGKVVQTYNKSTGLPEDMNTVKELSQLGFIGGVGLDVPINDNLFFRAEALLNVRLPSKQMKDMFDEMKKDEDFDSGKLTLGIGPRIKLGIGYKL